jgi:rhomboid protease GluP
MEQELTLDEKNVLTMKLLHYFITVRNYNPIVLQGVDNEIWLENLEEDCKVVRIVSGYIHNDEQFDFDVFKTKRILKKIKKKTLSFNMNVMSIFLDLGDNITKNINDNPNIMCINAHNENDLKNNELLNGIFPDLSKKMKYSEEGIELFMKITGDINKHNRRDASKFEKLFSVKVPYITYLLIAINCIFFFIPLLLGQYDYIIDLLCVHGPSIRAGQFYRLITGIFLHGSIFHLFFNCYALYVIGSQIESYLGKVKYLIIYFFSGVCGSLLSITLGGATASIGASGAIFGLMGSLCYFGYFYRVYLGNVLKTQLIPLIALNLGLGFLMNGVDNAAHIGGLIGGVIITKSLGIKDKYHSSDKINGWIISVIFLAFLMYMGLVLAGK